jgi:hypothetical protein
MNLLLYNYVYTHRLADFVMLRFLSEPMMVDGEAEDDRTVMAAARARRVRRQQRIQAALDRMAAAKDVKSSLKGDCALRTVYVCVCVWGGVHYLHHLRHCMYTLVVCLLHSTLHLSGK